jgi:two-component system LytT family response regulator
MSKTKIKTLIVDDEPLARRRIIRLLEAHAGVEISGECANGQEALEWIEAQHPDLVFLDVQMPDMDGFGVLQKLNFQQLPFIIFVTAYDHYALKAFEVFALDYLLKPFDDERFEEALGRAKSAIHQKKLQSFNEGMLRLLKDYQLRDLQSPGSDTSPGRAGESYPERLAIKNAGRIYFLKTSDIDWIEASGVYVTLHAGREKHLLRETMNNLENRLDPACFIRIHRSTIVNVEQIKELYPYDHGEYIIKLKDGRELKLSRSYRECLKRIWGDF